MEDASLQVSDDLEDASAKVSDKVEDAVLVISSNHHAQISDQDILKTTNDRRC